MMLALEDARLTPAEVDKVLLISGVIRMPIVRRFVATIMGKEPERGIDVSRSAAMGAVFRQLLCPEIYFGTYC
ncbi:MAG: Hsp70 family protein [Nitrososphaeraceae archaeon]